MSLGTDETGISLVSVGSLGSLSCRWVGPGHLEQGPRCSPLSCPRLQEPHLTALVVLLTLLPAPVMLAVVYKFWKKKYRGSE